MYTIFHIINAIIILYYYTDIVYIIEYILLIRYLYYFKSD